LRSVQTVFLASDDVTGEEFGILYENLRPRSEFPSLQALAYAERRPGVDGGSDRFVTTMVQPREGNARVVGLDLATQPDNLAAVLVSADSDRVAMSAPFHLVQVAQPDMAGEGVTLRLPVYSPGPSPESTAERRERLRGSLAISLLARPVISGAIPATNLEAMRLVVSDGDRILYDSDGGAGALSGRATLRKMHFGGRLWQVSMQPRRAAVLAWPQSA